MGMFSGHLIFPISVTSIRISCLLIRGVHVGCSQNYEPLLVMDYITAPKWDLDFGNYPCGQVLGTCCRLEIRPRHNSQANTNQGSDEQNRIRCSDAHCLSGLLLMTDPVF